jgi:RNA 2',3'-cyclic 3'-phosphodiesterase
VSDAKARLFVALDLPDPVREAIADWQAEALAALPELRAVKPEALHVTLCFLGWRDPGESEGIGEAAVAVAAAVPDLGLGAPAWLPRRRPRVLALEMDDAGGACASLQAAVSAALLHGAWLEPEERPFFPHVTVGRVRGGPRRDLHKRALHAPAPLRFSGAAVTLYRSRPTAAGATYEPLARAALPDG